MIMIMITLIHIMTTQLTIITINIINTLILITTLFIMTNVMFEPRDTGTDTPPGRARRATVSISSFTMAATLGLGCLGKAHPWQQLWKGMLLKAAAENQECGRGRICNFSSCIFNLLRHHGEIDTVVLTLPMTVTPPMPLSLVTACYWHPRSPHGWLRGSERTVAIAMAWFGIVQRCVLARCRLYSHDSVTADS